MADDRVEGASARRGAPEPNGGAGAHFKRYGVIYAIAIAVVLALVILPNVGGDDESETATGGETPDGQQTGGSEDATGWRPASGDLEHGSGTARSGVECEDGTGQLEDTAYAPPCLPEFTGDNGGATHRGVTEDTIRIVVRDFPSTPNSEAVQRELREAGFATPEETAEIRDQFIEYFNDNYELYGRRVELIEYESRFGNATAEALGQGREGACQDATQIVEELEAFAVMGGSAVFTECAAERGLPVLGAGAYYPESWYEDLHPYAWHTTMDCETIATQVAEYIGERLVGKPAIHAGDPALREETRVFGSYTPDNDQYVLCNDLTRQILSDDYDAPLTQPFRYALDVSRFAEQAARAVVQWKADGVTTVILGCDPISIGMLTNSAAEQDYAPEWVIIGTAGMDTDNFGRSYNQDQADGHMFGISHLDSTENIYGPDTEPGRLYAKINDGAEILGGTTGAFYTYVRLFNFLMAAGPDLTPDNMASGIASLPQLGGPDYPAGRWYWGDSHTGLIDSREVYWDGTAEPAPNELDRENLGRWVETYDGRRFTNGEWPSEDPPVYPGR